MQKFKVWALLTFCTLGVVGPTLAQDYPTYKPKPKVHKTAAATPSTTSTPEATEATKVDNTPLKTIRTDGKNSKSPIKLTDLTYYDPGYGAQYNSQIRVSATILNTAPVDEVKHITLDIQIKDTAGNVVKDFKTQVGNLKPGQTYKYEPELFANSLGTVLHPDVVIEHEEVPKNRRAVKK
jgi:hypothetical protein